MPETEARTGYAPVGELSMYYEIHGAGRPLLLLHGACRSWTRRSTSAP
jgi:hypothetical protein